MDKYGISEHVSRKYCATIKNQYNENGKLYTTAAEI